MSSSEVFKLQFGPTASALILAVSRGLASEILCVGTRGESKTTAALAAIGAHATEHKKAGYPLPVPWAGIIDTFTSHREKTHKSLLKPFWQGAWRLEDGGHKAILNCGGVDGVVLSLFGIEDTQAVDRARGEWACGWIDEAAPTLEGGGVDELVFDVMSTSLRVPTHARIKLVTENFPEESHWTWERWKPVAGAWGVSYHPDDRQRMTIMIPRGDSPHITDQDRREWANALRERPDLAARLLKGKPRSVQQGRAVAVLFQDGLSMGFDESKHVSPKRIYPIRGEKIFIGQDGGFCPVTTIGQILGDKIFVCASLVLESGMKQQYEYNVRPWLKKFAPCALNDPYEYIKGCYDPSLPDDESNRDRNPIDEIMEQVGDDWEPGPVDWEARKTLLFGCLTKSTFGFEPMLAIDPVDGAPRIKALRGGWHYKTNRYAEVIAEKPEKNHPDSDCGDSFCYMLARTGVAQPRVTQHRKTEVITKHQILQRP